MAASTASNIIDQDKLNEAIEFKDISSYDVVAPGTIITESDSDGTPPSVITPATQRIGTYVERIEVESKTHEDFGTGGTRIGQVTVFGEYADTRNIDHLRQGKNVTDLKHFVKGTLPFISVNTGKVLCENDGRVKHQMSSGITYGQSSLYKVFDDRKRKIIPFEDFPGKLDPVAFVNAGDYIMQYMIVTDLTRDIDKFINPDTMDGVIEVFEIRRSFANTNFSDIQINGIRCDLSTGDWNFDQKGSSLIDTKYEKKQAQYDYYEDAQDTLFSGNIFDLSGSFSAKLGYPVSASAYFDASADERFIGLTGSHDRYFALPGYISDGFHGISPFDDANNHIVNSYEHILHYATSHTSDGAYNLLKPWTNVVNSAYNYSFNESTNNNLVAAWVLDKDITDTVAIEDQSGNGHVLNQTNSSRRPPADSSYGTPAAVITSTPLRFDGVDDSISTPHHERLTFVSNADATDSPFTITFWIYTAATSGTDFVISKNNGTVGTREYSVFLSTRKVGLILYDDAASANIQAQIGDNMSAATWHHVAVIYSGGALAANIRFYIDGVATGTTTGGSGTYLGMANADLSRLDDFKSTRGPLNIGVNTGTTSPFSGLLANVEIWSRVLDAQQILSLYNVTSGIRNEETVSALNNILKTEISDIGSRFTSCNTGFIFPKNIVSASNMSGINNHLGVDSIAFGGLLK